MVEPHDGHLRLVAHAALARKPGPAAGMMQEFAKALMGAEADAL